jgi:hypothetical protein
LVARGSLKPWLLTGVRVATLGWLVAHFALVVAYVMPINPVTITLQPMLRATIGTYFEQDWGMFAPNPRSADVVLLARLLSAAEVAALPTQGLPADGWHDLSTPLWAGFHQNRFSAYDRLTRPQPRAIIAYLNGGPEAALWREYCQRGDQAACGVFQEQMAVARADAARLLAKLGSAFSREVGRPGEASHVALRARQLLPVPWSERYTAPRRVEDAELGVYLIDWGITPPGLYRAERPE